jgi:DNA-binding MarR family transcriptional regulator
MRMHEISALVRRPVKGVGRPSGASTVCVSLAEWHQCLRPNRINLLRFNRSRYIMRFMMNNPTDKLAAESDLTVDAQLCFALYSANLAMGKLYRRVLVEVGLTYPQYLVMLVLWERDNITVSELGGRLYLDSATLTPLLKRLEIAGFVTRERGSEDERRVLVCLTTAGRSLRDKAQGLPEIIFAAAECSSKGAEVLRKELHGLRASVIRNT